MDIYRPILSQKYSGDIYLSSSGQINPQKTILKNGVMSYEHLGSHKSGKIKAIGFKYGLSIVQMLF